MTILSRDYLRWPSEELFINCLHTKTYPFRIRARVITRYRYLAKHGFRPIPVEKVYVQIKKQTEAVTETSGTKRNGRLRTKKKAYVDQTQGSPRNHKRRMALELVVRWTSGGKGRPSRKVKKQFVPRVTTIHLRGNKYSGGQKEF